MNFYAPEKISGRRSKTPEGFLLIEATPIARTGVQIYAPQELGDKIKPGDDGMIRVNRKPEEVFASKAVLSANGKPFVNEHPNIGMIDPGSWRQFALGTMMNPRRGEGDAEDLLLADLLVCDKFAMDLIDAGKVELSCGYNCEYIETAPGEAEQRNITINHLALVSEGRCGERCVIGDQSVTAATTKENTMAARLSVKDWLAKHFPGKNISAVMDEAVPEEAAAALENSATHVHVHMPGGGGSDDEPEDPMTMLSNRIGAIEDRFKGFDDIAEWARGEKESKDKMIKDAAEEEERRKKEGDKTEDETAEEAEAEVGEKVTKDTKDSAKLAAVFQNTIALAEIIAPGLTVPTMDSAKPLRVTLDAICAHRRRALEAAWATEPGRMLVSDMQGAAGIAPGAALSSVPCAKVRQLFLGVAMAKKRMNNGGGGTVDQRHNDPHHGGISNVEDLQKRAKELWPMRSAKR